MPPEKWIKAARHKRSREIWLLAILLTQANDFFFTRINKKKNTILYIKSAKIITYRGKPGRLNFNPCLTNKTVNNAPITASHLSQISQESLSTSPS